MEDNQYSNLYKRLLEDEPRGSRYRHVARGIIDAVIKENNGKPFKEIKRAVRHAYPFGERNYWTYKCWLREQRAALRLLEVPSVKITKRDPQQLDLAETWGVGSKLQKVPRSKRIESVRKGSAEDSFLGSTELETGLDKIYSECSRDFE